MLRTAHKHIPFSIRILLVLLWMGGIFIVSSVPSLQSELPSTVDFVLRKMAHMVEYFILTILVWFVLIDRKIFFSTKYLTAGMISFLYAVSDEFHQRFVPGRYGTSTDVMIDSIGIIVALVVIFYTHKK
ncbi:MAG: VanZ family protein [Patescibacteria group bacterium]